MNNITEKILLDNYVFLSEEKGPVFGSPVSIIGGLKITWSYCTKQDDYGVFIYHDRDQCEQIVLLKIEGDINNLSKTSHFVKLSEMKYHKNISRIMEEHRKYLSQFNDDDNYIGYGRND